MASWASAGPAMLAPATNTLVRSPRPELARSDHGPDRTVARRPDLRMTGGSGSPSASGPKSATPA